MGDLICRKSMMRCLTPGMCSPHSGCQTSIIEDCDVRYAGDSGGTAVNPFGPLAGTISAEDYRRCMAERDQLKAENERLREVLAEKLIDSTMLTGIDIGNGSLTIGAKGGVCGIMADSFGQMLFESGAENYIEAFFSSSKHPELGQIVVTVKRETGKTPHQLRQVAEAERDQLRAEVEALRNDAERYRWLRSAENEVAITFGIHAWEDLSDEFMDAAIDAAMGNGGRADG